jgi:maltooligosyltrehalose trehalohydrolase
VTRLGKALAEGFEPDAGLSPGASVSFIQNHDQVGNRALGERIGKLAPPRAVRAAAEVYLMAPQTPMLFMGEEWDADSPFLFFCDFGQDLAPLVARGREEEFAGFFDQEGTDSIPDPGAEETLFKSALDWTRLEEPEHAGHLRLYRHLLALRREEITPRLGGMQGDESTYRTVGDRGLEVRWTLNDGSPLTLLANLGPVPLGVTEWPPGRRLYASEGVPDHGTELPGWSVMWYLAR